MHKLFSITTFLIVASAVFALPPEQLYALNCMGCHNVDGRGLDLGAESQVPPLKDFVGYFLHLPEGRAFIARVPGVAFSSLNDADTAKVLNWILTTQSPEQLPDNFIPFTAEDIHTYRKEALVEGVTVLRKQLIEQLTSQGIIANKTEP